MRGTLAAFVKPWLGRERGDADTRVSFVLRQMMPQMMQSSWTPTVAMQTATSIGFPQMMQNNEMMPQMMQNLKQSPMMPQMMHTMQNQMEMILRRRSI